MRLCLHDELVAGRRGTYTSLGPRIRSVHQLWRTTGVRICRLKAERTCSSSSSNSSAAATASCATHKCRQSTIPIHSTPQDFISPRGAARPPFSSSSPEYNTTPPDPPFDRFPHGHARPAQLTAPAVHCTHARARRTPGTPRLIANTLP